MINDKLKKLGDYIEELEKEKPNVLIEDFLEEIENEISNLPEEQLQLGNQFGNNIVITINEYIEKDTLKNIIGYHLLSILVSFIKKSRIEEQANLLGIDKNLYKKDMSLLFKGKY